MLTARGIQQHFQHGARAQSGPDDVCNSLQALFASTKHPPPCRTLPEAANSCTFKTTETWCSSREGCTATSIDVFSISRKNPEFCGTSELHCTFAAVMLPNWAFFPVSLFVEVDITLMGACILARAARRRAQTTLIG